LKKEKMAEFESECGGEDKDCVEEKAADYRKGIYMSSIAYFQRAAEIEGTSEDKAGTIAVVGSIVLLLVVMVLAYCCCLSGMASFHLFLSHWQSFSRFFERQGRSSRQQVQFLKA